MRSSALSRYTIRFVALGYLALVLVLPLSVIFFRTFQDGIGPVIDSLTDPLFIHALQLTLTAVAIVACPQNGTSASGEK